MLIQLKKRLLPYAMLKRVFMVRHRNNNTHTTKIPKSSKALSIHHQLSIYSVSFTSGKFFLQYFLEIIHDLYSTAEENKSCSYNSSLFNLMG